VLFPSRSIDAVTSIMLAPIPLSAIYALANTAIHITKITKK
jgi:hypothetical protein